VADELVFVGQAEPAGRGAGGDDERPGFDPRAVDFQFERPLGEVGIFDGAVHILGAEANRLLLHVLDELGAHDAVREAGEVFHLRGDGELAAGFVAGDDQRRQGGAGGIDGGCISGTARANYDDVTHKEKCKEGWGAEATPIPQSNTQNLAAGVCRL